MQQPPIMTEQYRGYRIVPLGDGPRLPDHIRPWHGDSRGRWEGDTLVVETTNLHPLQHDVQQSMFANELDRRPGNQVSE